MILEVNPDGNYPPGQGKGLWAPENIEERKTIQESYDKNQKKESVDNTDPNFRNLKVQQFILSLVICPKYNNIIHSIDCRKCGFMVYEKEGVLCCAYKKT